MADNVEKIVSVTEWYKHYHQENKINNNTKIENIKATIGGFKMWFYFSLFSVILMLLCFILGPIVDKLMNAETSNDMFFICFVGVPIVSFFVFTIPTVISILMRKKIENINWLNMKNEFISILVGGLIGWYECCVYLGVSKKERMRIEEKVLEIDNEHLN